MNNSEGINRVKMSLFIASAFLTLSATSHAAPSRR
jgi:hypothetical protein